MTKRIFLTNSQKKKVILQEPTFTPELNQLLPKFIKNDVSSAYNKSRLKKDDNRRNKSADNIEGTYDFKSFQSNNALKKKNLNISTDQIDTNNISTKEEKKKEVSNKYHCNSIRIMKEIENVSGVKNGKKKN